MVFSLAIRYCIGGKGKPDIIIFSYADGLDFYGEWEKFYGEKYSVS